MTLRHEEQDKAAGGAIKDEAMGHRERHQRHHAMRGTVGIVATGGNVKAEDKGSAIDTVNIVALQETLSTLSCHGKTHHNLQP